MKQFLTGLVMGAVLTTGVSTWAVEHQIKLFVDGKEIAFADAPPQMINGRVMVPARPVAEALGAKVVWNQQEQSVVITSRGTAATDDAWVSVDELNKAYGVWVGSDGSTMTLTHKGQTFTVPLRGSTVEGTLNGKAIRGEMRNSRLYLHRGDLIAAGFIQ